MSPADYHRQSPQQQSVFLCVIMQPAAFVCGICAICGRITRKSTLSISTNETPKSPADLADLRRQNHKTTLTSSPHQSVFLCEIMQLAAFVCVICVICERITHKLTQSIAQTNPQKSLAEYADNRRQNHETTLTTICLSLRDNAACCVPLRDLRYLRYLRENNTQEYSINQHIQTPISLPLISQIYAEKYNCGKPYYISALKFTI